MSGQDHSNGPDPVRKASLLRTIKAVAWSFLGIRKGAEYDKDVNQLNPVHVVIVGVLAVIVFVVALVLLVNYVVSSGVASA
ncbi:MAG: DUF2970 domain-containing protein [Burkholderiaceae bacterium]|nr:DUF2970 domain-containing protein [Roseateles sp.]MBV8470949.1 DUF2970 domain-containing protein [Burkholderiaceae bacterium]